MGKEKEKMKLNIKGIGPSRLIILCLAGVFLVVLSFPNMLSLNKDSKDNANEVNYGVVSSDSRNQQGDLADTDTYLDTLEFRLKNVLKKVEGIGDVEVMITLKGSKELITLKESPYTQESMNEVDGEGGSRLSSSIDKGDNTVIVDSGLGESMPYVIKEIEPEVLGVVVIAQGGDNAIIQKDITEAIQVLFNVPAHKIKVMKMNK